MLAAILDTPSCLGLRARASENLIAIFSRRLYLIPRSLKLIRYISSGKADSDETMGFLDSV
jgi:hypothetical protein